MKLTYRIYPGNAEHYPRLGFAVAGPNATARELAGLIEVLESLRAIMLRDETDSGEVEFNEPAGPNYNRKPQQ